MPRLRLAGALALAAGFAGVALSTPGLFAPATALSFITGVSFTGCLAMGMTLVTLSGNLMSFSLGATAGAASMVYVAALDAGGVWCALALALSFGAAVSAVQGAMVGALRANPIIVSIGASVLIYGAAQPLTGNGTFYPGAAQPGWAHATLAGLPLPALAFLLALLLCQALLSLTTFGRRVLLVGDSFSAARAAGLGPSLTIVGAYSWAGLFAALSGVMLALQYDRGSIDFGRNGDYAAIAAVLVGGTPISGGQGSGLRTVAGVLAVGAVQTVLVLRGLRQEWQQLITGLIVLGVIVAGARRRA